MDGRIGVAIVGCGYWGVNYVRVFSELPEARVLWACDRDPQRLDVVRQRFPTVGLASDLDVVLGDPGVSALVVATPATDHYPVSRAGLEAGKHLLVEKPLATTVEDAQNLVALSQEAGRTLMVGHTFLYNAGIRKMKECIESPDFGQVYYLRATRTNLGPIRQDVNALWDLAPHDVSIFNYLLGSEPEAVWALGSRLLRNRREDAGFIHLGYPGGVIGAIHVSWVEPQKVREVVAVGSQQRVVFDDLNPQERIRVFEKGVSPAETEVDSFGEFHLLIRDGAIVSPRVEVSEPLKNQCRHFLECVAEGKTPLTDGQNGLSVVRVMVAADASMWRDGARVQVAEVS